MSDYDRDLQNAGYCGHICPATGSQFDGYCCTMPVDHVLDGEPIHKAIQLSGDLAGRVNGAWQHDGTPAMDPVDMTPIEVCGIDAPIDADTRARVTARLAAVDEKIRLLILDRQAQHTGDAARDLLKDCRSLVASFTEQSENEHEALQLACEAIAVLVRKLSGVDQIPAQ